MSTSARFDLSLLVPGQAQKEVFVNEAIQHLELLVQPVVEGMPSNEPPVNPGLGQLFIVGAAPTGDFEGQAHAIACWTLGGWRFRNPFDGLEVLVGSTRLRASFRSGKWHFGVVDAASVRVDGKQVLSGQQAAIPDAEGGSVIDEQARSTLAAILRTMREHGLIAHE